MIVAQKYTKKLQLKNRFSIQIKLDSHFSVFFDVITPEFYIAYLRIP